MKAWSCRHRSSGGGDDERANDSQSASHSTAALFNRYATAFHADANTNHADFGGLPLLDDIQAFTRSNSAYGKSGGSRRSPSVVDGTYRLRLFRSSTHTLSLTRANNYPPSPLHTRTAWMASRMFSIADEARLQTTAGVALLENSRLLRWSDPKAAFVAASEKDFEGYPTKSLDPHFGRVIRWIIFSAGAEFFIKGLCLAHGIEVRRPDPKMVPDYPGDVASGRAGQKVGHSPVRK
jgi:hypothetical protein